MFPHERQRIAKALGTNHPVPYFASRGFEGYRVCPLLKAGRCSVYAIRPMICRLYGVTDEMPCPHGCTPERMLTEHQAMELMDDAMRA
jgi:Fe-S-cluster containining protein